jgi:hypothetical protein
MELVVPQSTPNNRALDKVVNLNLAIPSNHRLATIHTATPTIQAHTMLRTLISTRATVSILGDFMELKAGFTNNIPVIIQVPIIIPAHTMLRTSISTRTTVTILEDLMELKAGFTNNIPITA